MPEIFSGSDLKSTKQTNQSDENHTDVNATTFDQSDNSSSADQGDDIKSIDHQRQILRGVRTKRGFRRGAHRTEVDSQFLSKDGEEKHRKRSVEDYSEVIGRRSSTRNPIAAFAPKPFRTKFSTQGKEEEIILVLRKHPITQVKWLLIAFTLSLAPFLFGSIDLLGFLPGNYQFAGLILWYLMLTGFVLESFLTWFFNVYIITDERIIDVDFLSLIYRNISTAKIDNIEDVTATTGGALKALFNFGTVSIQTAAEKREFEFEDVPRPAQVTKLINELILEEEREKIEGRVS